MNQNNLYPCPSCGFLVFTEPIGSYDICPICNWEDDHVQLRYPGHNGGANGESLKEYQDEILKKIPIEIKEYMGKKRDISWRPLTDQEVVDSDIKSGTDYFHAALKDFPEYYWKK